jgi:DnaJ-domain-containing protein 1
VSFTRKVIDGARSGLSSLMNKVAADDTPLSHVDEEGLQSELADRVAARKGARSPADNPIAKLAGSSSAAREKRAKLAERRSARVDSERQKRARAENEAHEAAFRDAQRRAQQQARSSSSRSGGKSAGQRARDKARSIFDRDDPKIVEHYKTLQLPNGAPFDEVKKAYRKLMRKYHPDLHTGSEKKQKAATELSMRVTQAYNALDEHLNGK